MPLFITDNNVFTSSIPIPEVGDRVTADSVHYAFQGLMDRTAWLRSNASFHSPFRGPSGYEQVWLKNEYDGGWVSQGANTQTMVQVSGSNTYYHANTIGENSRGVRFVSHIQRTCLAGCKDAVWVMNPSNVIRVSMWITPQTACTGTQMLIEKRYRPDQAIASSGSIFQPGIAFDMSLDRIDLNTPGHNTLQVRMRTGTSGSNSMVQQLVTSLNAVDTEHGLVTPFQLNHVGFVYDGNGVLTAYVNGMQQSSVIVTGSLDWNIDGPTGVGPYVLGSRVSQNDSQYQSFVGYIHEVRVEKGPVVELTNAQWWRDTYLTGSRKYGWLSNT